jgi:hypothetical protein
MTSLQVNEVGHARLSAGVAAAAVCLWLTWGGNGTRALVAHVVAGFDARWLPRVAARLLLRGREPADPVDPPSRTAAGFLNPHRTSRSRINASARRA